MENIDIMIQLINSVGFPIFVSIWFMFRTEKIIKDNTIALLKLIEAINDK